MLAGFLQVYQGQVGAVDPDPAPPPLPGGAAEVARFFMDVPQPIQIAGLIIGGLAAVVGAVLLWKHRQRVISWIAHLPTTVKAMALAILIGVGAVASVAGYQVYDFVEHDNRFCTGCHVMADAYLRFEESAHAPLGCKDCHAQPRTESARQLYLWVLERPEEVGPHSPVPDARCTSCHVDGDPQEWPQIAASLGHRVHFDSDDPELGELMCVTCHGVSVHEFTPVDATCGECHEAEATIQLGRMAAETELHCVACHDFLSDRPAELPGVPEGIALLPDRPQCAACHEMGELLREGELDVDPHGAVCGACHNPHTQDTPYDAVETCMGCHEDVEELTIFHTGTHAPVLPNCTECHSAHTWEVQGSDCLSCHETILGQVDDGGYAPPTGPGPGRVTPSGRVEAIVEAPSFGHPMEPVMELEGEAPPNGAGSVTPWALSAMHGASSRPDAPPAREQAAGSTVPSDRVEGRPQPSVRDTLPTPRPFLHRQHRALSCVECHGTAEEHGVITVRTARECAACHHDPVRGYDCADCHGPEQLVPPREVVWPMHLTVWDEPRDRAFAFQHELHEGLECQECHTGPTLLAVERECAACHDDHHRPQAECSQCHVPAEPGIHGLEVHLTCTSSGCHAGTAGERPELSRTLCLTCHVEQEDHEPGLSCQECHMVPVEPPLRPASAPGPAHSGTESSA